MPVSPEDSEEIRQLIARYCLLFDAHEAKEWAALFTDDGVIEIGASRAEHDLTGLHGHRLRSHGGLSEQIVPFIVSHPVNEKYRSLAATRRLRNFDIFDFALNGVQ